MDTNTKRQVISTLLREGRRDLAQQLVTAESLKAAASRAFKATVLPRLTQMQKQGKGREDFRDFFFGRVLKGLEPSVKWKLYLPPKVSLAQMMQALTALYERWEAKL